MNNTKQKFSLSAIGFSNYALDIDGKAYKTTPTGEQKIKTDKKHCLFLIDDKGESHRKPLKQIYREIFDKEFCIDKIVSLDGEEWREIANTKGRYFVSNCGRVKSLCGYKAKILQPTIRQNGYAVVKINNKNTMIHRLVAFSFCEYDKNKTALEIHHIDFNRSNNTSDNLLVLTAAEHHAIHRKKKE